MDKKPRNKLTAYAFFVQTCREEHKRKHPDEQVIFTEFSRKCADRWKTMSDYEKKRFNMMSECDQRRYECEKRAFKLSNVKRKDGESSKAKPDKRKKSADPNAPKKAVTSFFIYCREEETKVREENTDKTVSNIRKIMANQWNALDKQSKRKYEVLAEEDKARYNSEKNEYDNLMVASK